MNYLEQQVIMKSNKLLIEGNNKLITENKMQLAIINQLKEELENERENNGTYEYVGQGKRLKELEEEVANYEKMSSGYIKAVEDYDKKIESKDNEIKVLKREIEKMNEYIVKGIDEKNRINAQMNKPTAKDEKIERLEKSANEYYYNWTESQKENEDLKRMLQKWKDTVKILLELL